MAQLGKGYTFGATEQVTSTKLHNLVESGTVTEIVNADVASDAAIVESKFAWDDSTGHTHSGSGDGTKVDLSAPGAIGGTTPNSGAFSDLTATTIDGAIGSVTPSTIVGTSLGLATGATCTGIADEDDMSSNSATLMATQQSIKAYVDSVMSGLPLWSFSLGETYNATAGSTAGIASFTSGNPPDPISGEKIAWMVEGTSYQTVIVTKFKKKAGVSTVTFYGYIETGGAATGTQYMNVDIGGQSGAASAAGSGTPGWVSGTVDVSSLTNGSVYDVQIQLKHSSTLTVALYSTVAYGS